MKSHPILPLMLGIFVILGVAFLNFSGAIENIVSAQQVSPPIEPDGGGEFMFAPRDEMTDEGRKEIQSRIRENIEELERSGRLAPASPEVVAFDWPVRKAPGVADFDVDAISNYVDQNPAFPTQLRDWNCGARTYDQSSGYNHAGIDIFTWPFSWKKMDNNEVEVVAGAPGTIVFKSDGNYDRNCGFGSGNWNAIYVRHSDNSVAWYGHMKNGSLSAKVVGDTVVAGERLGVVGSSGNSTGPHLHFELYNSAGQLQDPFQGPCNTLNSFTWWAAQEPYRVSRVNRLMTQSAGPVFPACPTQETTNEKTLFRPGETIVTAAYYRDQMAGQQTQYRLIRPDDTVFQSWTHNSPNTYSASFWWWSWILPANALNGVWKFRAIYESVTYDQEFNVDAHRTVAGRVTTPDGRGLRNALVSITDSQNDARTVTTSSFGFYTFDSVQIFQQYTIRVSSKRYRFTSQTLTVNDNLFNVDFVGLE